MLLLGSGLALCGARSSASLGSYWFGHRLDIMTRNYFERRSVLVVLSPVKSHTCVIVLYNQSINQSISQSVNHTLHQAINLMILYSQSTNHYLVQSMLSQSVNQFTCQLVSISDDPGSLFNIKILSYCYRKFHCGYKTILRPFYLHNGICYTSKMPSLY